MPMMMLPPSIRIRHLLSISPMLISSLQQYTYRLDIIPRIIRLRYVGIISPLHHPIVDLRRSLYRRLVLLLRSPHVLTDRTRPYPRSKIVPDLILLWSLVRAWLPVVRVTAQPVDPFRVCVCDTASAEESTFSCCQVCCCVATHVFFSLSKSRVMWWLLVALCLLYGGVAG